jgi:hypothetical protein
LIDEYHRLRTSVIEALRKNIEILRHPNSWSLNEITQSSKPIVLMSVGGISGPPDEVSLRVILLLRKVAEFAEVHVPIQSKDDNSRDVKLSGTFV